MSFPIFSKAQIREYKNYVWKSYSYQPDNKHKLLHGIKLRRDKMDNLKNWKIFEETGRIQDYLKFTNERRVNEAMENFISKVEGEKRDGRKGNSNGNSHFINEHKGIR